MPKIFQRLSDALRRTLTDPESEKRIWLMVLIAYIIILLSMPIWGWWLHVSLHGP